MMRRRHSRRGRQSGGFTPALLRAADVLAHAPSVVTVAVPIAAAGLVDTARGRAPDGALAPVNVAFGRHVDTMPNNVPAP